MSISIHALLAESDNQHPLGTTRTTYFYPRSPCGERPVMNNIVFVPGKFLSTLSLRRATWPGLLARPFFIISIHALLAESDSLIDDLEPSNTHFYPRSPCGERLNKVPNQRKIDQFLSTLSLRRATGQRKSLPGGLENFYPRSPCGERLESKLAYYSPSPFLSTLSLRRATLRVLDGSKSSIISIHALLAESDRTF